MTSYQYISDRWTTVLGDGNFVVLFDGNGGLPAVTAVLMTGPGIVASFPAVIKDRQAPLGWADADGNATTNSTVFSRAAVVHAVWNADELVPAPAIYTVTFVCADGCSVFGTDGAVSTTVITSGFLRFNVTTAPGYVFSGVSADYGRVYSDGAGYILDRVTADTTITVTALVPITIADRDGGR